MIGEKKAAAVSGIVQASAGVGDALMSPALQFLISWHGIAFSIGSFAMLMAATLPVIFWIGAKGREMPAQERESASAEKERLSDIIRDAFRNRTYRLIFIGFSTCGFNMSIIESHLFSQFVSWGISQNAASMVMMIYGIMTMLGAMATGFLCMRFPMKNVLGTVYGLRVLISLSMLLIPGSLPLALIATGCLGAQATRQCLPQQDLSRGSSARGRWPFTMASRLSDIRLERSSAHPSAGSARSSSGPMLRSGQPTRSFALLPHRQAMQSEDRDSAGI